jgi:hypothetical protein
MTTAARTDWLTMIMLGIFEVLEDPVGSQRLVDWMLATI